MTKALGDERLRKVVVRRDSRVFELDADMLAIGITWCPTSNWRNCCSVASSAAL